MTKRIHTALLAEFAEFMAVQMGLLFPKERWLDLLKGIQAASKEFGFDDPEACIRWLMSTSLKKQHIETLALQFTVGETYFFREPKIFEALEKHILPELIRSRWESDRRIRFWSAGCCTGEEAYSIAILFSRMIPDLHTWKISILGTDINPQFLQRAEEGVYREWSFRGTPYWLKENYFKVNAEGNYVIHPQIKKMVKFQSLNLVEDSYPSLFNDTNAMDIVFCRNVLMYFTQDHMNRIIERFHQSLMDKGWLVVGSSETSHIFFPQYTACNFPGAILYRKEKEAKRRYRDFVRGDGNDSAWDADPAFSTFVPRFHPREEKPAAAPARPRPVPEPAAETVVAAPPEPVSEYEQALGLYENGRYEEVIERSEKKLNGNGSDPKLMSLLAKAYANRGQLKDAIVWCEKAISAEKLNPGHYHLRAVILQEQGDVENAIASLKRALYLDSDFVLAHFMLGNLSQQAGKIRESRKYFENALALLKGVGQETVLTESGGMTAGRMQQLILSTLNRGMNA
ncbi:tetratricopeptide repeat protein [bacterium]|nr:tetratricopeptide repeat protein [bacterium]